MKLPVTLPALCVWIYTLSAQPGALRLLPSPQSRTIPSDLKLRTPAPNLDRSPAPSVLIPLYISGRGADRHDVTATVAIYVRNDHA